ncbi:hypothetical protein [Streptomyces sp. NPDC054794]
MAAGFGGPDCDFPDCTAARARPTQGKPGPPPKFCVQHNNRRDRQIAYRARKALETERAARPEPLPVDRAVAQGAREQVVLADLLPRVLTALQAVHQGQKAGADSAAVAAHLAAVRSDADARVTQAEQAREQAVQDANQAREEAARSAQVAQDARTERQAALREAACALGEAAGADQRAHADRAAHEELSAVHRQLRDAHQELTGAHTQLQDRWREQETTLAQVTAEHRRLLADHGRLQGEKQAQDAHVAELSRAKALLEESQQRTAVELAAAQSELTGLHARLTELQAHREELKAAYERLAARHDDERAEHRRELAALRAQLDAARAATAPDAGRGEADVVPDRAHEPDRLVPADSDGEDAGDGPSVPDAIVDLGVYGGSGWTLVRYADDHSRWRVLRDGEIEGVIQPEHSLTGTSLLGWSARTSSTVRLHPPHRHEHYANREQAAGAVIRDVLRRAPGAMSSAAAGPQPSRPLVNRRRTRWSPQ